MAGDRQDATIGCRGRVRGIDGAIRVEAGEITPGEAADGGERTADDDLAVGLHEGDERTTFGVDLERGVEGAVSADPGEAIAEGPRREAARLDCGEITAEDDLAVGLKREGGHGGVGRGREAGVERAVGVQARDVGPLGGDRAATPDGCELTADHDIAVRSERDGDDVAAKVGVELRVEGAVGIEPGEAVAGGGVFVAGRLERRKRAAENDLAVALHGERGHGVVGIRIEFGIDGAVGVEAGDAIARRHDAGAGRLQGGEATRDHDLAIADGGARGAREIRGLELRNEGEDDAVGVRVVGGVERAIGVEAGHVVAGGGGGAGLHGGEATADDEFAVGLEREGIHLRERAARDVRVECKVEGSVGVEAGHAIARRRGGGTVGLEGGEIAADHDAAVGLEDQGADGAVGVGIKGGVDRAVGVEAGEIVADRGDTSAGAERRELAGDEEFSVGLGCQDIDVAIDVGIKAIGCRRALSKGGNGAQEESGNEQRAQGRPEKRSGEHR